MEFIDKKINEALNKELEATESNQIEDFKKKSSKRFFATISAFIDKERYLKQSPKNNDNSWKRYCYKATEQLQTDLNRLGLEYQKVTGAWFGSMENSFLVWNTAYTFEQYQALMLKLNENYKQWGICIGKWVEEEKKYSIDLWKTDSLNDIKYNIISNFTKVSVTDGLKEFGTILTRHIYSKDGKIDKNKTTAVKFEAIERNICCAASESLSGAYIRDKLLKEFLGNEFKEIYK